MLTLNKKNGNSFVKNRLSILEKTFGDETKLIKKKYLGREVIADCYYVCNKKWMSFITYPWQPRIYLDLLKRNLSPSTIKKIAALKNTLIGSRNEL